MVLYKHNKATYEKLKELFSFGNKAAVVQPTGTGKSFVMLQLISDNKSKAFLVCSPSTYIFSQIKDHAAKNDVQLDNCQFLTYSKISLMGETELSTFAADYIILDEFHRCGAAEWGRGIGLLLSANSSAKLLGTSATPIRYLDSMRDMAQELFDGNYAVNMSLADAIRMKILPLPVYVTTLMSFSDDIARLEKRAASTANPRLKHILMGKIQKAKRLISKQNCGLDMIFAKHIPNVSGKYIMFCPGIERLNDAVSECDGWFAGVNRDIHKYSVNSLNTASEKEFAAFSEDNSPVLKLLFCVDMLNEGVHVDGIDGVIMLRSTQSANVFYQQLGRALSCSKNKKPVIFDIVNNYETGDTAKQYSQIMQIGRENGSSSEDDIQFELYDYVRDIRDILEELNSGINNTWDIMFDIVKEYKNKAGAFPPTSEIYDNFRIGQWCSVQRKIRKTGKLSAERIEKLESIDFIWDRYEDGWLNTYSEVRTFTQKYGRLPTRADSKSSEDIKYIYEWCRNQIQINKRGKMPLAHSTALRSLGVDLDVNKDDVWRVKYDILSKYAAEKEHLPTKTDAAQNKELNSVYCWMMNQRVAYRDKKLSEQRIKKLEDIGFEFGSYDSWSKSFESLRGFYKENGRFPKAGERFEDKAVGQWFLKQLKSYRAGELSLKQCKKMESFGIPLENRFALQWNENYMSLRCFVEINHRLPKVLNESESKSLYFWYKKQKRKIEANALSSEQTQKILEIDTFIRH